MPLLQKLYSTFGSKILIEPLIVDLKHRGVDTSTKTLDLTEGEKAIFRDLIHAHVAVLLSSVHAVSDTPDHAGSCAAELDVILAESGSVEHGIERGDLVDLHGFHFQNLSDFVHSRKCKEIVVLLLSDEKDWNNG